MDKTFDFLTAIKHLLDGKKVHGKDWVNTYLMLDKDTKCVFNERGQRLDIMQFMNIEEWVMCDSDIDDHFQIISDYKDIYVDEFTSYKYDFEGWPIPDIDNWLFKFSNNYHPHKGDIIVYKEVADYHRELKTLDSCPVGKIINYNDYMVYVKFTNKETPVELSIEEMKQLCYIILNEDSYYNIPTTIYYNEDGSSFTTSIAFEDDMHYTDAVISIADVVNKISNITLVDLIMNYYWEDSPHLSKFDVNEFKKTLNDEPDNLIEEILESGDKLYASIPYGKVPPTEGDTVIPKNSKVFTDRSKIIHTTSYDVDILHYFMEDPYNYDIEEFTNLFNKLIPNNMPALVSRNGKLSTNDEIYYEYNAGQNETFLIIDIKIGNFSKKGITIQRKSNPDDIYEISLRDLHRLFTWKD
jgi:hypothetical protein